jgi:ParB family transcriptional regulator, chromosome partitioning protein
VNLDLSGLDQFRASDLLDAGAPSGAVGSRSGSAGSCAPDEMDLDLIDFDPGQPRRSLNDETLAELAASIRAVGVLEPVSLRRHPQQPGRYVVNRGERRVRASRLAGLRTVPWFLDERVDPYAQVIENLHREDLSPFDLARFVAEREAEGHSRAEIARRLHKPASFITEVAQLLDAPPEVQAVFERGRARDTRVLYRLTRAVQRDPAAVAPLLKNDGPITREAVDAVDTPRVRRRPADDGARRVEATKAATALLVEHEGQRGRLALEGHCGKRTGQVCFDNGARATIELAQLKPIAWTAR